MKYKIATKSLVYYIFVCDAMQLEMHVNAHCNAGINKFIPVMRDQIILYALRLHCAASKNIVNQAYSAD